HLRPPKVCAHDRVWAAMRGIAAGVVVACVVGLGLAGGASARPSKRLPIYLVGVASRSINPDPDGTFAGNPVYLGGYGIGGGSPVLEGRPATGILGDGIQVRAFVVSDGVHPLAIADIETQGWFVAVKNGPYGLP